VLYGGLLGLAEALAGADRRDVLAQWRRRGRRAFHAEAQARGSLDGTAL
jgi:hypothetical protein